MTKPRYEDVHRKCALCGCDITWPFGTYRYGISAGMICYDCDAKVTEENRRRRQAINDKKWARKIKPYFRNDPVGKIAKDLYKSGMKPTQIARRLNITTTMVYQKLEDVEDE